MAPKVEAYLALNWVPRVEQLADGTYKLTVPPLRDLELFADSEEELQAGWRDALASHLRAYLSVGKVVPTPLPLWGEVTSGPPGVDQLQPLETQFVVR